MMATRKSSSIETTPDLFATKSPASSRIRVGIGGWVFAPWRNNFYPAGLVQRLELEYASRHVTAIEINSTYYGTQQTATYAKWRDATPDGFVFSAKAPKRITQARRLASTGAQIEDFIGGIAELGEKLGPLVWQFDIGHTINHDDFAKFVELLPKNAGQYTLRHVLDVRDSAYVTSELLELARHHNVGTVFSQSDQYPCFADITSDFVYARLMGSRSEEANGYSDTELNTWAQHIRAWQQGEDPEELPHIGAARAPKQPREVFVFFIAAAKERNPAAAMALIKRL